MGLLRHDGEVEGAVVKDDAVPELCAVAAHAMLKRISQNDEVTKVFQVNFRAGCCDMRYLPASLARRGYFLIKSVANANSQAIT